MLKKEKKKTSPEGKLQIKWEENLKHFTTYHTQSTQIRTICTDEEEASTNYKA